jgi:branched-chain amino acid aminotransferase
MTPPQTIESSTRAVIITGPTSHTPHCWIAGEWTTLDDHAITVATQGLHYGTGVFEGIRAYWTPRDSCVYVVRLAEHVNRLLDSCQLMRIDLGLTADDLCDIVIETVERNAFRGDLYIRSVAFKSKLSPGTPFGVGLDGVEDHVAVYATPMPSASQLRSIRCAVSGWRRIPSDCLPARAKVTGAYANLALAVDEARAAGYDDAILLNTRGKVAEASTANVFTVSRDMLATPSLDCDILAGQTRACILELAAYLGIPVAQHPIDLAELLTADEVFTTGTGSEISAVVQINGRAIGTGMPGPTTQALFDNYRARVHRDVDQHLAWTTPAFPRSTDSPTHPSDA